MVASSVGWSVVFSIARRYCTLAGTVFGDLLPCLSQGDRWSTLQSTFPMLEKRKTETLVVALSLFLPRSSRAPSSCANEHEQQKQQQKSHTRKHTLTHTSSRAAHPVIVGVVILMLLLLPPMHYKRAPEMIFPHGHTRTHAHTRTETETHTARFRS